ncbi:MAG: two-component system sensor histidine kinase KdbD, partial [Planctomycetota bacterium]
MTSPGTAPERPTKRGRLKIFFGYAAEVGMARAMLQAARRPNAEGRRVVVGRRVIGNESGLGSSPLDGREHWEPLGVGWVDEVFALEPDLVLVLDVGRPGSIGNRHRPRHQDVERLLDAGIDVW